MNVFRSNEFFKGITLPAPQPHETSPLTEKVPNVPYMIIDFLQKCLDKDPEKRWTCDQLLVHRYFDDFEFTIPSKEESMKRNQSRVSTVSFLFCIFNFGNRRIGNIFIYLWLNRDYSDSREGVTKIDFQSIFDRHFSTLSR